MQLINLLASGIVKKVWTKVTWAYPSSQKQGECGITQPKVHIFGPPCTISIYPCLHILSRLLHCDSPPGCFLRQRTHATSSSDGAVKSGSYGRAITVDNLAFYRVNLQIVGHGWVESVLFWLLRPVCFAAQLRQMFEQLKYVSPT